jgi:hypothetical protein
LPGTTGVREESATTRIQAAEGRVIAITGRAVPGAQQLAHEQYGYMAKLVLATEIRSTGDP